MWERAERCPPSHTTLGVDDELLLAAWHQPDMYAYSAVLESAWRLFGSDTGELFEKLLDVETDAAITVGRAVQQLCPHPELERLLDAAGVTDPDLWQLAPF
jgi:hypothetical protein